MRIHAFHHLYQQRLERSTKPFNARGSKVARCQYCQVAQQDCLCQHQPTASTEVAVLLLLSENEVFKPSNTGRLILDTVADGHAYQWSRTEPEAAMLELLNSPDYQPILVFPEQYVEDHSRLVANTTTSSDLTRKPLLVFLDGSWREARRMFNKSPYLSQLPVLSISPQRVSQYMMRRSENDQHLATAEVAALVFKQLGHEQLHKTLTMWFEVFRESYLNSKTRNRRDDTKPALNEYIMSRNEKSL